MLLSIIYFDNHLILNPGKCHGLLIEDQVQLHKINLSDLEATGSNNKKPLCFLNNEKLSTVRQFDHWPLILALRFL